MDKITADELLVELERLSKRNDESLKTVTELQDELGWTRYKIVKALKAAMKSGRLIRGNKKSDDGIDGVLRPVRAYRLAKAKAKKGA